jgi:hypothetical protein
MKRTMLLGWSVAVMLVGCGGNKVDQLFDKQESLAQKMCECESITMTTTEACLAEIETDRPTEVELECLRGVADRNADFDEPASCLLDAFSDLESCVGSAGCNAAALESCSDAAGAAIEVCPEPSEATQAELNACLSDG